MKKIILTMLLLISIPFSLMAGTERYIPSDNIAVLGSIQTHRIANEIDIPEVKELFDVPGISYLYIKKNVGIFIMPQPKTPFKESLLTEGMLLTNIDGIDFFSDEDSFLGSNGEVMIALISLDDKLLPNSNTEVNSDIVKLGLDAFAVADTQGTNPLLSKLNLDSDISVAYKQNATAFITNDSPNPELNDFLMDRMTKLYGENTYNYFDLNAQNGRFVFSGGVDLDPNSTYAEMLKEHTQQEAVYAQFINTFGMSDLMTLAAGMPEGLFGKIYGAFMDQDMVANLYNLPGSGPQIGLVLSILSQLGGSMYVGMDSSDMTLIGAGDTPILLPSITIALSFADTGALSMIKSLAAGAATESFENDTYGFDLEGTMIYVRFDKNALIASTSSAAILAYNEGKQSPKALELKEKLSTNKAAYFAMDLNLIMETYGLNAMFPALDVLDQLSMGSNSMTGVNSEGYLSFKSQDNAWKILVDMFVKLNTSLEANQD